MNAQLQSDINQHKAAEQNIHNVAEQGNQNAAEQVNHIPGQGDNKQLDVVPQANVDNGGVNQMNQKADNILNKRGEYALCWCMLCLWLLNWTHCYWFS